MLGSTGNMCPTHGHRRAGCTILFTSGWLGLILMLSTGISAQARQLVVISDLEPDDRIALMLLAAEVPADRIALVGTTLMHAGRKKLLMRQLLDQLGLDRVPVLQGSGGRAGDYPAIASSAAARTYQDEGRGLLADAALARVEREPHSSTALSDAIRVQLHRHAGTEFLLLAPPTDLLSALQAEPALVAGIGHIHVMGGWVERRAQDGGVERRTTYNWNMDPRAAAALMAMRQLPMTLYSSHLIKPAFGGGSINAANAPEVIAALTSLRGVHPAADAFLRAAASWDHHLMGEIPALQQLIGPHAGRQFTPADPLVVVGLTTPAVIQRRKPVAVRIDLDDLDPDSGYPVDLAEDAGSRIELVEAVDALLFRRRVVAGLERLAGR